MIDRQTLKTLGWSDELVDAVEKAAGGLATPFELPTSAVTQELQVLTSDALDIGDAPPVAATELMVREPST